MIWRSCAEVSFAPTLERAGTYGETPPSPCGTVTLRTRELHEHVAAGRHGRTHDNRPRSGHGSHCSG